MFSTAGRTPPNIIGGETVAIDIPHAGYGVGFVGHPEDDVDLAAFNVSGTHHKAYWRTIGPEALADFEDPALAAGTQVWFVGYPEGYYDKKHNLPLMRSGIIASQPRVDFDGKPGFIVDGQCLPGSSGSPVFAPLGNVAKLVGILSSTAVRSQPVRAVGREERPLARIDVNVDRRHKLVRRYQVTDAAVHDSQVVDDILDPDNTASEVWADSAYRSAEIEAKLKEKGLKSRIHRKGYRNKPLSEREKRGNTTRSKVRARVEHVFGAQSNDMGGTLVRSIGMVRARARIGLKNLAYNMRRRRFAWKSKCSLVLDLPLRPLCCLILRMHS